MTIEEFAELAHLPVAEIEAYRDAGLLDPDADGNFDDKDVFRLQVVSIHREKGLSIQELVDQIKNSQLIGLMRIFGRLGTYPINDVAERVGIPLDKLIELDTAAGLGTGTWDDADLEALNGIKAMVAAGLPWEAIIDGARVYGDAMRRVAEAGVRMTHQYLCEELQSRGMSGSEIGVTVFGAVEVIEPITKRLLDHLHQDHLLKAAIDHALLHLDEDATGSLKEEETIVFIDLALYTTLTQAHGDEMAADVLNRFDSVVRRLVLKHGGTLVKQNGDAFMLVFHDPADSLRFALDVSSDISSEPDFPEIRVGIHHGPVLYRVGDYVGHTVNVASRVSAMAAAGSILVTESVAGAAERAAVEVEEAGVRRARGVEEPLKLFRLKVTHGRPTSRDRVCGMAVTGGGAGSVRHAGTEYVFCSRDCMKKFLDNPAKYGVAVP